MNNQTSLFGEILKKESELIVVPGLLYIPNFITQKEHDNLLQEIDKLEWLKDLNRRVQHYGYKYDYKKRSIDMTMKLGPFPDFIKYITNKLIENKMINFLPDQAIINDYQIGQGISPHIDCEPCFENTIISLSLNSVCLMDFYNKKDTEKTFQKFIEPRSLLILQDEIRYEWLHGIRANKSFNFEGRKFKRERRVSITFRKVLLKN